MNTFAFNASHGEYPVEPVVKTGRSTNTKIDRSEPFRSQRTKPSSETEGGVALGDAAFTILICAGEAGRAHFRISIRCARVRCCLSNAARVAG